MNFSEKSKLEIYKGTIDNVAHDFSRWPHPMDIPEYKAPDGFVWRQNARHGAGWFLEETGPYSMGRTICGTVWWYRRKALGLFKKVNIHAPARSA